MASETLGARARLARKSGAVLKLQLSYLRNRKPKDPILVFEGFDDVGPFSAWVARLRRKSEFSPLTGDGKGQVLELVGLLRKDTTGLASRVYCFVDRDFDDTRGVAVGNDLYCTDRYSVESYLVSDEVLRSVLTDELRCTEDGTDEAAILQTFRGLLSQFVEHMAEPNRRLFRARRFGIGCASKSESISDYVDVSLESVTPAVDRNIEALIRLSREPSPGPALEAVDQEFSELDGCLRYRGKYLLKFFLKWLGLLAQERRTNTAGVFNSAINIKFSEGNLSLRSLASRSEIPVGLPEFVARIFP